jgi:glycosyltransferase involved in cell wall biosynthesis
VKIYHLSTAPFSGGAARAGFRLHEGLLREPGVESVWLDAEGSAHGPSVTKLPQPLKRSPFFLRMKRKKWAKITREHFAPTTPPASNPIGWGSIEMLEKLPKPDVWNLHWVSWFLDWGNLLPWMAEQAPIVWTLHDLNPLRGIWHYEPQAEERTRVRMCYEAEAMEIKRGALAKIPKDRITFVGPSQWMVGECQKSDITKGFQCKNIPYGIDQSVFVKRNGQLLRSMFGISADGAVLGFIADSVNDPRKGMVQLLEAINLLSSHFNLNLLTVGRGELPAAGCRVVHLGKISNDTILSHFYSACDIFICPSLQDNLPNTVMEALACCTPVVGYACGGIPDMLQNHGASKIVEKVGDTTELARNIRDLLCRDPFTANAEISRQRNLLEEYTLATQARRYRSLYEFLISQD